jgi:hypothetical protein
LFQGTLLGGGYKNIIWELSPSIMGPDVD